MNAEPVALGWNELAGAIRTKTTLPADQMELLASPWFLTFMSFFLTDQARPW